MALQKREEMTAAVFERVVSTGDLSVLAPAERLHYVGTVCEQLGLNPLTSGFQYISFEGKLQMYAGKQTAAQLGFIHNLKVTLEYDKITDGLFVVKATATGQDGLRVVEDIGAVDLTGARGKQLENGLMKAATKAKRRAVLGYTGLGLLDESEVETLTGAVYVEVDPKTGEVIGERGVVEEPPKERPKRSPHAKPNLDGMAQALKDGDLSLAKQYLDWAKDSRNSGHPNVQDSLNRAEDAYNYAVEQAAEQAAGQESEGETHLPNQDLVEATIGYTRAAYNSGDDENPNSKDLDWVDDDAKAAEMAEGVSEDQRTSKQRAAPLEALAEWLEPHGYAVADIGDVLKMPWDEWEKLMGDPATALEKAQQRISEEWGIGID